MNTQLQTLFETYNLSEKDRYDIAQIFSLLPSDKQQNLLRNFPTLAARLKQIEESMKQEQEILLWDLYSDIDKAIEVERRHRLVMDT